MKPLVISKPFATAGEYIISQEQGDEDPFALQYTDAKLGIELVIHKGGDTDGGSIPNFAKGVFDPLLDRTAHGFIFHDELWRHRVYYQELYDQLGITFVETNRIMADIHKKAGCNWREIHLTRLAVRWFGYWKWRMPSDRVISIKKPTLIVSRINGRKINSN